MLLAISYIPTVRLYNTIRRAYNCEPIRPDNDNIGILITEDMSVLDISGMSGILDISEVYPVKYFGNNTAYYNEDGKLLGTD